MSERLWKKIDKHNRPTYINDEDFCIYAREYISGRGYKGETNSLIYNFKKPPIKKGTPEWKYRTEAIKQFKIEAQLLFHKNSSAKVTAIPNSEIKTDPEYDNRFEDLFEELLKSRPNLTIEWPVENKETMKVSHISEKRPIPKFIKNNYVWKGFKTKHPKVLFIFDDVITQGAHFRAISDFLREKDYTGKIVGIIWAKTVWPSDGEG